VISSDFDALRSRVEYPPAWRPEPGETAVGEAESWADFSKADPESGETKSCRILTLRGEDGTKVSVWCWHSILRAELADVVPGDLVAISYAGKKPRQKGDGSYHHYRVAVEKRAAERPTESAGGQDAEIPF
jgi:hypothetical protein